MMDMLIDNFIIQTLISTILGGTFGYYLARKQYRESKVDRNFSEFLLLLVSIDELLKAINEYLKTYTKYNVNRDKKMENVGK